MIYAILITQTAIIAALAGISAMLYAHIKILITRLNNMEERVLRLEQWAWGTKRNLPFQRGHYD